MARLPYLERDDLAPEARHIYDEIAGSRGSVAPNFKVLLKQPGGHLQAGSPRGLRPVRNSSQCPDQGAGRAHRRSGVRWRLRLDHE